MHARKRRNAKMNGGTVSPTAVHAGTQQPAMTIQLARTVPMPRSALPAWLKTKTPARRKPAKGLWVEIFCCEEIRST
jgi:hypothetical protein